MTEETTPDSPVESEESEPKKKKKGKKRPSDFEIARTILQRTSERKQAFLVKNLGEDSDILFLCSCDEKGFTYGASKLGISIIQIDDPELMTIVQATLDKLYGCQPETSFSGFVSLRDQIAALGKTKGESFDEEVVVNPHGSAAVHKTSVDGKRSTTYYAKAIESLFHVQLVAHYCKIYRPLLTTMSEDYLYYPYSLESNETSSMVILPPPLPAHPFYTFYPHGFRSIAIKGLDVAVVKGLQDFPYPVIEEDMIVFHQEGAAAQLVHRVQAQGWRMITIRPNAIVFPTLSTPLLSTGHHDL